MSIYQLWSSDQYNQGNIHKTSSDFQVVFKEMNRLLCDENFNSSLSFDGQVDNAECFRIAFIDDEGKELENYVYAGKTASGGKHKVLLLNDAGEVLDEQKLEDIDVNYRICLGIPNYGTKHAKKDGAVYAKAYQYEVDPQTKKKVRKFDYITDIESKDIEEKTVYFIVKQK